MTPETLKTAFGRFLTGVVVVTTNKDDGTPVGFTANSFSSVSIDPPLISVCPGEFLSSFDIFKNARAFNVCILAADQQQVAKTFAGFKGDRFAQVDWSVANNGLPMIDGSSAVFECTSHQDVPAGDHIIKIGKVHEVTLNDQVPTLGYWQGDFFNSSLVENVE